LTHERVEPVSIVTRLKTAGGAEVDGHEVFALVDLVVPDDGAYV
jgi:hypothetical protein